MPVSGADSEAARHVLLISQLSIDHGLTATVPVGSRGSPTNGRSHPLVTSPVLGEREAAAHSPNPMETPYCCEQRLL